MLRAVWITLIWLVSIAVPVQGYAAAAMAGCAPGHHGTAGAPGQGADGTGHSHDAMAAPHSHAANVAVVGAHTHGGSVAQDPAQDAAQDAAHDAAHDPAHAPDAVTTPGHGAEGACAPCASCCVVAALPVTMVVFQPVPLVDFFVPHAPRGLASFVAESPDRPPRSILV